LGALHGIPNPSAANFGHTNIIPPSKKASIAVINKKKERGIMTKGTLFYKW
jgi:hypothetical protein